MCHSALKNRCRAAHSLDHPAARGAQTNVVPQRWPDSGAESHSAGRAEFSNGFRRSWRRSQRQ